MSDQTLQAVHDAIAAHIADVNEDVNVLLTDWQITASAAIANDMHRTMYYNISTNSPYHHRLGLMYRGLEMLEGGDEDDD